MAIFLSSSYLTFLVLESKSMRKQARVDTMLHQSYDFREHSQLLYKEPLVQFFLHSSSRALAHSKDIGYLVPSMFVHAETLLCEDRVPAS